MWARDAVSPECAVLRMQRVELANLDLDLDNFARSMSCDSKLNQVPLVPWPSANLLRWSFQADCDLRRVFEKRFKSWTLAVKSRWCPNFVPSSDSAGLPGNEEIGPEPGAHSCIGAGTWFSASDQGGFCPASGANESKFAQFSEIEPECGDAAMELTAMISTNFVQGWRRGSESNRRIKVLQTSPLPLGYRALN